MIKSKSKRTDMDSLLNSANNISKNQISGNSNGSSMNIDDSTMRAILNKLLNSSALSNKINSSVTVNGGGGGSSSGSGSSMTLSELETKLKKLIDLDTGDGFFNYLQAELISTGKIVADSGEFKDLSALVAMIDNLLAGNVSAELGHIISLTADNVSISEAVIKDLIAAQITVSMLQAGTISADKFNIKSDDGGLSIIGNTMQFKDQNGNIRIQIGRDANNDFTFVLYDETGTGVLIDSTGIKESAIADGLIVNDMIAPETISKDKLAFNVVEGDENGNLDAGKVIVDGHGIDVEFQSIRTEITNVKPYTLSVYSSNGTSFKRGKTDTYLSPILFLGQDNVTDNFEDENFIWTRQSTDSDGDHYWNSAHENRTKNLHITNDDVYIGATFSCSFYIDDTLVATAAL